MEIFGIVLSVPAAFVASTVYSFLVRWLTSRFPWLVKPRGRCVHFCVDWSRVRVESTGSIGHSAKPRDHRANLLSVTPGSVFPEHSGIRKCLDTSGTERRILEIAYGWCVLRCARATGRPYTSRGF